MHTHEAPSTAPRTRPQAGGEVTPSTPEAGIQLIEDKRPETALQRKLIESVRSRPATSVGQGNGVVQRVVWGRKVNKDDVTKTEDFLSALNWLRPRLENNAHNDVKHLNPFIGRSGVAVAGASAETGHAYTSSNPGIGRSGVAVAEASTETGHAHTSSNPGGLGEFPESAAATDENPEFNASDIMEDNVFIKYFTLIPGIKYSKVAQDLKFKNREKYKELRHAYNLEYLKIKRDFEQETIEDVNKNPYLIQSPNQALKDLDVMHPKSKIEGHLIVDLDQKNTALNQEIAAALPEGAAHVSGKDKAVHHAGGITAKHSAAFRKMLKLREETGSVFFRPAGKEAVGHLNNNMPAKPLWIKGKSIDLSKFIGKAMWAILIAKLQADYRYNAEQIIGFVRNLG